MKIGFDVISDLNLSPEESFNWEGKSTSLYCIIAGNVSSDIRTVAQTLLHLSKLYQGVFYIPGHLEYQHISSISGRTDQIAKLCKSIKNVALLHNHVVIIDGVALLGANCWYNIPDNSDPIFNIEKHNHKQEDLVYLGNSLRQLQLHLDVRKIVLVTNSVPGPDLFFGEETKLEDPFIPQMVLVKDSEHKVSHWVYGTYPKEVDTVLNGINYINNSYLKKTPYWAKRIEV
jgi:hypothetical protein